MFASKVKYASLPTKDMQKLPEAMDSARLTPEYGGGYIAFLEVSHHIHVRACPPFWISVQDMAIMRYYD